MTGCAAAAFVPPAYFAGISTTRHMVDTNLATALALTRTVALTVSMASQALPPRPRPSAASAPAETGGDSLIPTGSPPQTPNQPSGPSPPQSSSARIPRSTGAAGLAVPLQPPTGLGAVRAYGSRPAISDRAAAAASTVADALTTAPRRRLGRLSDPPVVMM